MPNQNVGTSHDFKAEFERFLMEAAKLPESARQVCRANTDVVRNNLRIGVESIFQPEVVEKILRELPSADLEPMKELQLLGETLAHAARQVAPPPKSDAIGVAVARGRELRNSFVNQLEVLVDVGLIKDEELAPLRGGKGHIDLANDLIDSVALFKRHEKELVGKLAITPKMIEEGREVGTFLTSRVSPASAVKAPPSTRNPAAEARDQLWSLLVHRHQELRRIAAWVWLDEADKHVPPLKAYQRKRKSEEAQAGETPVPSPEATTEAAPT
jgi:hypothetical protein